MKSRWLSLLVGFFLALITVSPALAHANLARSTPAANASLQSAPVEIRLWFTESLEPNYSRFSLRNSSGDLVQTPASQIDPVDHQQMFMQSGGLPNGLYTVTWRAISAADGHSTEGSFAFGIGVAVANNPASVIDESVASAGVIIRWLNLLSLSLAVGSIAFWVFVAHPVLLEDYEIVCQWWYRLTGFGWLMVGVSALLLLLLQVSTNADTSLFSALSSPALSDVLTNTTFGQIWLARIALWGLFGAILWLSRRDQRALWGTLVLGALILVTQSLYSHASAAPDRVAIANDWLHLVSSSLWVGGLAAFALALLTLRQEEHRTVVSARLVAAFSNFARVAVALLVITGLYAAWLEVGSIDALLHTVYGAALVVKSLLFVPLLLFAAVNLIVTQRGLGRGQPLWFGRLRGLVGAEITLTVGVLLAVGVMTSGSPARGVEALRAAAAAPPQAQPYLDVEIVNNQMMHLQIVPGYVGQNEFTVTPFDENANPITDASLIRLRFTNLDQNLGDSELRPTSTGNGTYSVRGANLSTPGHWRIRMTVARPGKFDTVVDFNATIEPPPAAPDLGAITMIPTADRALAATLSGLALLGVVGFFTVDMRRQGMNLGKLLVIGALVLGVSLLVTGAQGFLFAAPAPDATAVPVVSNGSSKSSLANPVPADQASIKAGQTLYTQNCVICHGAAGKGDGPVGLTLNPRPADLTQHTVVGLHTDGQLYEWLTNGYPHSAMPAFGNRLSDTDRWNLVNYIRTLAQTS